MMGFVAGSRGAFRRSNLRRGLWVAAFGIGLLLASRPALASPDDGWDTRFFANGAWDQSGSAYVTAVVSSGGYVYVAGNFKSMFGVNANNIARWDGATWSALGSGTAGGTGIVYALAASGSDLYVGGTFTTAGGVPAANIAKWDGSSWSALGSGTNAQVTALSVSGSSVYAGGYFSTAGGIGASNVARWDGSTWSALGVGTDAVVLALTTVGTDLYAGGAFTNAGGSPANYIAKWNGSSWSALGTGMNGYVWALTHNGTDVYAGGYFTTAGGGGAAYIARWDGSGWSALGSGMNSYVFSLTVAGSDLYAMGGFSTAGGAPAYVLARWNGASWSGITNSFSINGFAPMALGSSGTDVYVGGQYSGIGGTAAVNIARWNGSTWSLATTTPGVGFESSGFYPGVRALAYSPSGDLYAGGVFEFAGTTAATSVAKWNGTGWSPLGTGLEGTTDANYFHGWTASLGFYGGDLIVGGNFVTAGGVTVSNIARWNGTSFVALGSGMNAGAHVNALAEYNGELYAGGTFSSAGGTSASNIARWNGTTWSAVGTGVDNSVLALAVVGPDLYAGGVFTTAGGSPATYIARWNGTSWSAVGTGMNSYVYALAVAGSDLYAAGLFTTAGGTPTNYVARWNGTSWSALGSGMDGYVYGLGTVGSTVYAAGNFLTAGGVPANSVAKWNGVGWSTLGSGLAGCVGFSCTFAGAGPLVIAGDDVYFGGRFTSAGGKPSSFIALWHNCGNGVVDPTEQCDDGNLVNGDCCSSTCQFEIGGNVCPDDGNPCTNDQCDGSGGCAHPNNTAPCDDGLYCDGTDVCSGGVCTHGGDPCPGPNGDGNCSQSCDEATDSCTAPDPNGSACTDGLFCDGTDTCAAGACTNHTGNPCPGPDGDGNCSESCDEATDNCTAPDPNGSPCTDGLFCDGTDTCVGGACTGHTGDPCSGGPECAHACNEAADNCFDLAATACTNDGNFCTDDHCSGAGACIHPNNTLPCDDGLFCNGADVCGGGACTHAGNPCAGGLACHDVCDEGADTCLVPNGTACSDANACTMGETCTAGVCGGGSTTVCPLCETCDTVGGCQVAPRTGCKVPTAPGKASLQLTDKTPDTGDQAVFKWAAGQATTLAELGDPITTDDYALCLYAGGGASLVFKGTAPAGGTCGAGPCWKPSGASGVKYGDKAATPDGTVQVLLKSGAAGKAKMTFKGKGPLLTGRPLGLPPPPLALPVRAQLQGENGVCFEATYSTPNANKPGSFKSKSD